jgi:hypothetical protein
MSRQIFLDMDGVIVNLQCPLQDLHHMDVNLAFHRHELELTDEQLWRGTDAIWWATLPWMDDGRAILALCEDAVGVENVFMCSTPAAWPGSADGKIRWIEEQMPNYKRRFILTPKKSCCANPRTLLIDDYERNTLEFHKEGGATLLCPRPWNANCNLNTLEYLREGIKEMLE